MAGRDVASLIEIAALNHKLRSFGYNAAAEFDQRLLKKMTDEQSA
jgi:HPr kinase/phosphorylase